MKKSILAMAAAMMAAAANGTDIYDTSLRFTPAKTRKKSPAEQKKCKSCKHYHNKLKTKDSIYHCEVGRYVSSPMSVACEHYEKRKKK